LELEAALSVVEAGPVDPASPVGFADIAQLFSELQPYQRRARQLLACIPGVILPTACFIAIPFSSLDQLRLQGGWEDT
jgi:hypothetical protein